MIFCKNTGLLLSGSISGDVGTHLEYKIHKDKMYVHAYDAWYDLSIECSPMYMRYFNDFKHCIQTKFCETNRDFDCDESYVFYINEYGLNRFDLNTEFIQKNHLQLESQYNNKNKLDFDSIFLVENTIMMRCQNEIHYNYSKSIEYQSPMFMKVFKNETKKLFI
jgi:hypothetical protein